MDRREKKRGKNSPAPQKETIAAHFKNPSSRHIPSNVRERVEGMDEEGGVK